MTFFDKLNDALDADTLVVLIFFASFFLILAIVCLAAIINHFLLAVPLYIMADKAGYAYPFLAFLPIGNYYLMHILPMKEYSFLGLYKTYERRNGFWIMFLLIYVIPFVIPMVSMVFMFIPILSYIFSFIVFILGIVVNIAGLVSKAIMMIDLAETYMKDDKSLCIVLGIAGCVVPYAFAIACISFCKKEPEFGFGNYYYPVIKMDEEE